MIYDTLMRLPFLCWVVVAALAQFAGLVQHTQVAPADGIHVAMRCSTIGFLLLLATAVLIRTPPSAKAQGWEPRVSALAGTFLIYAIVMCPRRGLPASAEVVSTLLIIIGTAAAIISLGQLGRSFSIMAESRQLVTTGPYQWVRHPLYLAEEIAVVGLFMQFASVWTALLLGAQIAFQLRRIHNEEVVLCASFPEYDTYRSHTARLIPGVRSRHYCESSASARAKLRISERIGTRRRPAHSSRSRLP